MTNYVTTNGLNDGNFQSERQFAQSISRTIDFSKFTTTGVAGVAADTADVLTIPAGFVVESVFTQIIATSTTASSTFGVGDSSSSVGYLPNTTSATAAAGTMTSASGAYLFTTFATTPAVTAVTAAGKAYATADTIRVVLGTTAPLNGKVKIVVRGFTVV